MNARCRRPPADLHRVLVWPYAGVSERAATVRNGDDENELEISIDRVRGKIGMNKELPRCYKS